MRPLRHLTPRYIIARITDIAFRRRNPELPWLTPASIGMLETILTKYDIGLEFGSGRSTLWFAKRVGRMISIEHNARWYESVASRIRTQGITNVEYRFTQVSEDVYLGVFDEFPPESFDFILIDGIKRDLCATRALDALKPGGVLILDNVNQYLPHQTRSPNSRTPEEGPASGRWVSIWATLSTWRFVWTSSGVFDTALFFKPIQDR
jgi:predicted O-methyltransferase YrrM